MHTWYRRLLQITMACCAALLVFTAGCGGDEYEKRFSDSVRHLKDTGQPLQRSGIVEQPAPGDGQPPQGQPPADQPQPAQAPGG